MLSLMKMSGQGQNNTLTWSIKKFFEISKDKYLHKDDMIYIILSKWKGDKTGTKHYTFWV